MSNLYFGGVSKKPGRLRDAGRYGGVGAASANLLPLLFEKIL
jgi:hypothetical protein